MSPVRVLAVCTGNVCRSPLTERLLDAGLRCRGVESGVEVRSAGTGALVGQPMTRPTRQLLAEDRVDGADFVARALTAQMVADADLVLALTRRHRGQAVVLHPPASRYSFTLREVERLLPLAGRLPGDDVLERLRAVPAAVAAARGLVPVPDPRLDDVIDPYRRDDAVYGRMAAQIRPAVRALLDAVAPPRLDPPPGRQATRQGR